MDGSMINTKIERDNVITPSSNFYIMNDISPDFILIIFQLLICDKEPLIVNLQ